MRSPAAGSSRVAAQFGQLVVERVRGWSGNKGSSPFRLRIALLITVLFALAFAVLGTYGVSTRRSSIEVANHAAGNLIELQGIRVSVVQADSVASQSYLVGGGEDPAKRQEYLGRVDTASNDLVDVSLKLDLDSTQSQQLQLAGTSLTTYTGLVEQARANNRQGFPIGAAYQRQANAQVTTIVEALRSVEADQRREVNVNLGAAHRAGVWLVLVGWVLVAFLVLGGLWLALLFRRIVNVPLAIAVLALLGMVIAGGAAQAKAVNGADDAVGGSLTTADLVAQARAAAYDAVSQEALTLINRGNGAANEASWQAASGITEAALADACDRDGRKVVCTLSDSWVSYQSAHQDLRDDDNGGNWDKAVAVSLGDSYLGVKQTATTDPFNAFADKSAQLLSDSATIAESDLSSATDQLGLVRILVFVAGLLVALLAAIGYAQRLREYR